MRKNPTTTKNSPNTLKANSANELAAQFQRRQERFRILVCVNGEEASYEGVSLAAKICTDETSDIVLLYVRRTDQGLSSGGLQVSTARHNLLEWGLELPGIKYLRQGFDMLMEQNFLGQEWKEQFSHTDIFGDPLGDNKVEYRGINGKRIILKLKTAPDVSSGILHQQELGPYNMILMGPSIQWNADWRAMLHTNAVQKIASLAPSSVMTVRNACQNGNGFLLSTDGSKHSLSAKRQGAVIARALGEPVRILGTADDDRELPNLEQRIEKFAKQLTADGFDVLDWKITIGDAVRSTLEAGNNSSAIVVSDKQASRFSRFFRGSIAFDIMRLATTSVLNVR